MPNNIHLQTDFNASIAVVTWIEPTATDNSGYQTLSSSYQPADSFQIGVSMVNYTSVDPSGNMEFDEFYVNITGRFQFALFYNSVLTKCFHASKMHYS